MLAEFAFGVVCLSESSFSSSCWLLLGELSPPMRFLMVKLTIAKASTVITSPMQAYRIVFLAFSSLPVSPAEVI